MAQADKFEYRIAFSLVLEVAHFSGVKLSITTSKVGKVPQTYFAEIESVSKVRVRVDLFGQVFHKEVKRERVGVCVQHSDLFAENVFK